MQTDTPVNPQKLRTGWRRMAHAFGYSLAGLRAGWGETAFRQEALAALVMLPAAWWLGNTWTEVSLLAGTVLLVMIVGTALDFAPTVLILTPVLMPLVREAGIDPVYFGVLFIINNAIGLLTPPVGTVLNVVCGVGRIPMHDVIRGVMPFLLSQVVVMGALIAFPSLVMMPLKWLLMK